MANKIYIEKYIDARAFYSTWAEPNVNILRHLNNEIIRKTEDMAFILLEKKMYY